MHRFTRILATTALLVLTAAPLRAADIYVSPAGGGDGTIGSPTDLQTALNTAAASAENDTVFLLQGTYPAAATFTYAVTGANTGSLLVSGGWAAGFAYQSPSYPALTVLDGQDARRVLKITAAGAAADVAVTLENLTVQNGYTNEYAAAPAETGYGAGISALNLDGARLRLVLRWCDVLANETAHLSSQGGGLYATCDYQLRSCTFRDNQTKYVGGAIASSFAAPYDQSLAPTIDDSTFQANGAYNASTPNYAGSHVYTTVAPVFRNTTFIGKAGGASSGASGIGANYGAHPTFENCVFTGNVATYWGGAIQFWDAGGDIRGCLFLNNESGAGGDGAGGAISTHDPTPASPRAVSVVNCTFVGNFTGGYQTYGGAIHNRVQALAVANSIFWNNGQPGQYGGSYALYDESASATVDYSDVQGGLAGTFFSGVGNITVDPFVGEAWDYPYRLLADSPCVDTGSNVAVPAGFIADFEGQPRVFGANDFENPLVDMGWDEFYDGELLLAFPSKDTVWLNDGTAKQIPWTCVKVPDNVRLSLWRGSPADGGTEVRQIAASVPCAAQSYNWKLPITLADRDDYTVVIQSLALPALVEWNWVATQHLQLTWPNRGGLTQGATYNLTWKSGGLAGAFVRIELYGGGRRKLIIAVGAPNTGRYAWKVPFAVAPGGGYQIRVSTTSPRVAEDYSDNYFRIIPAVTLTAPNGGQVWQRGTAQKIAWSYKNNPGTAVRLELYRGATLDRTIAASVPIGAGGAGSFTWRIPAAQAADTTYTVKVRSVAYPKVYDFGNNAFSITE